MTSHFDPFTPASQPRAGRKSAIGYQLLQPQSVEPNQQYPLVLFLHGAGERGDDNRAQLKYLPTWMAEPSYRQKFPCYLLAPQCPSGEWWIDIDWNGPEPSMTAQISDRLEAVLAAVDRTVEQHPIDTSRIYLTGLSMGGFGAWDLAIREPLRWAAILTICGGADTSHAARIAKLPIWCFHGAKDEVVSVDYSRRMIAAIRAAGGDPRYTEMPNVGHDSWTPAYRDPAALKWLFSHHKG